MRKKFITCFLALCLLAVMMPPMAWAQSTQQVQKTASADIGKSLDIDDGSIIISATGYKQGDVQEEASYTGAYVITQSSNETANTITVEGGTQNITIQNLNIAVTAPTKEAGNFVPLTVKNGTVTLNLEGANKMAGSSTKSDGKGGFVNGAGRTVLVKNGGFLTIEGAGSLSLSEKQLASGTHDIIGLQVEYGGRLTVNGGTLNAAGAGTGAGIGTGDKSVFGNAGNVIINGGRVTATGGKSSKGYADGIGGLAGDPSTANLVEITGGNIMVNSIRAVKLQYKGGSIVFSGPVTTGNHKDYNVIDGRLIINKTNAFTAKYTQLYFKDQKNQSITIKVDENDAWSAVTDQNCYLATYLAPGSHSVKYGDDEKGVTVYAGYTNSVVDDECTCNGQGTFEWNVPQDIIIYDTDAVSDVYDLRAVYQPADGCTAKHHNQYNALTYELAEGTENASLQNGRLTLNKADKAYTVTVKIKDLTGAEAGTKTVNVSFSTEKGFNIDTGTINVATAGDGKVTYTQGAKTLTVEENQKVLVTGTADGHQIVINSGSPAIVLRDMTLTNKSTNPIKINGGAPTLWLEGQNTVKMTGGDSVFNQAHGIAILVANGAKLNVDSEIAAEGGVEFDPFNNVKFSVIEQNPVPVRYKGSLNVEGRRGSIAAYALNQNQNVEINIKGGNIYGKTQTGIYGDLPTFIGNAAHASNNTYGICKVNLTGGNVACDIRGYYGLGIGGAYSDVNITGGCINISGIGTNTADRTIGIGGRKAKVTIGTDEGTEGAPYIYADLGNLNDANGTCASVIGGGNTPVYIKSGTVEAWAKDNGAAIGLGHSYFSCGEIVISGGIVGAYSGNVSIGSKVPSDHEGSAKITITGGKVDTTGALGTPLANEGSIITISGEKTVVNGAGSARADITVSDGASLNIGRIEGSVTASETGTKVNVINDVNGDAAASDGAEIIIGGNVEGNLSADKDSSFGVGGIVLGEVQTEAATETTLYVAVFCNNDHVSKRVVHKQKGQALGDEFPENPVLDGFIFLGWNDGNGATVTKDTVINNTFNVYAQWKEDPDLAVDAAASILKGEVITLIGDTLSADQCDTVKAAVEELLKDSTFIRRNGTITVSFAQNRFTAKLSLDDKNIDVNLVAALVKENPENDQEKADYALKDVKDMDIRLPAGTTEKALTAAAEKALRAIVKPYDETPVNVTVNRLYGHVYRISAVVGTATASKDVAVVPEYYSPGSVGGFVPAPTEQKPVITIDEHAVVTLSKDGTTATIKTADGYEVAEVTLNGVSQGKITTVHGLKTGDKLVIITVKKNDGEKNLRLIKGVQSTTIRLSSKISDAGKGWIRVRYKKSLGFKVDHYEIFRSTKKTKFGKKAYFVTKKNSTSGVYKNTKNIKKGTRYYYKVRGVRKIEGKTYYTKWSNRVMRTGR